MTPTGNSFTGTYSYSLDSKGRVNIPAKMRKALSPANDHTFVATRGADACVALYPVEIWNRIERKLVQLNKGRALNRHFARNFVRYAEYLRFDAQGRIPLPPALVDYAGIDKNAEIVGMTNHIEIWNPERLEENDARYADQTEELEQIAQEINLY